MDIVSENLLYTEQEKFLQMLRFLYIVDFGIIKTVSSDKSKVDVRHITKPVSYDIANNGAELLGQETITTDVELLFFGSTLFKIQWDVQVGDIVLLLGSRDFVNKIQGTTQPDKPNADGVNVFSHYRQTNLKALPLASKVNTSINIVLSVDDTQVKLDAKTKDVNIQGQNIKLGSDSPTESFVKGSTLQPGLNAMVTTLANSGTPVTGGNFLVYLNAIITAAGTFLGFTTSGQMLSTKIKGV